MGVPLVLYHVGERTFFIEQLESDILCQGFKFSSYDSFKSLAVCYSTYILDLTLLQYSLFSAPKAFIKKTADSLEIQIEEAVKVKLLLILNSSDYVLFIVEVWPATCEPAACLEDARLYCCRCCHYFVNYDQLTTKRWHAPSMQIEKPLWMTKNWLSIEVS